MKRIILLACVFALVALGPWTDDLIATDITYQESPELTREIERLEKLYPEQFPGAVKYDRSGHQYTTYIIARMAGKDRVLSHKLAFFSQFPDDIAKYSATAAAVKIFNLSYRKQIMSTLHSLHGGDEAAVLKRRKILKGLIREGTQNNTLKPYQLGLITHAFADSYAHTKVEDGKIVAFNDGVGHLWHGHTPDIIAYDPDKYNEYACNLFIALSLKDLCRPDIDDLSIMIQGLKKSRNAELMKFEIFSKEKYGFSDDYYSENGESWKKDVSEDDVLSTIKLIESKL